MKSAYLHDAKWMFKNQLHFYTLTSPSLLRWLFYMVKTFVFQKNWCNSHSHSSQMFCLLLSCIICYSSKICITSASQNTIELIDHHCLWRLHPYVDLFFSQWASLLVGVSQCCFLDKICSNTNWYLLSICY